MNNSSISAVLTSLGSGASGSLAALAQREKTGKGAYVDSALVDSTVGVLSNQALNYLVSVSYTTLTLPTSDLVLIPGGALPL